MKTSKFLVVVFLVLAWLWIWTLPSGQQLDLSDELASLPDHDLRGMADEFWRQGEEDTALMVLDYLIEQRMGDEPAALQVRNDYLRKLQSDKTPVGRMKAAGWGFASGKVKNWESLAGSTVGDLVVYGDLRDLTRELVFEDNKDEFVIALSALGLTTTFFPPADPAVAVIKGLKKTGKLSEPLIKQLTKVFRAIKEAPDGASKILKLKEGVLPFHELSKYSNTWTEYATLIKHTDSIDQLKAVTKIAAHQPGNARKLTQILAISGRKGVDGAKQALDTILTHGQRGMDALYAAVRKGPVGLKFVAEHPVLVIRGLKNIRKTGVWGTHEWSDFARKAGLIATFVKAGALGFLSAVIFWIVVPGWVLQRITPKPSGDTAMPAKSAPTLLTSSLGVSGLLGLIVALLVLAYTGIVSSAASTNTASFSASDPAAFAAPGAASNPVLSAAMIIVTIVLQAGIWLFVRSKVADVERTGSTSHLQLKRLENLDIFLDLPLYAGLALTIFSFILISYDAGMSRLLAYTSTIIGILAAVSLRIHLVHPLKERLLMRNESATE